MVPQVIMYIHINIQNKDIFKFQIKTLLNLNFRLTHQLYAYIM